VGRRQERSDPAAKLSGTGAKAPAERRYRRLFASMSEGFAYCRMLYDDAGSPVDLEYLDVNDSFYRLTGLKDVVGRLVSDVIPGHRDTNRELFDAYGRVATTGVPEEFDVDVTALGLRLHLSVYQPEQGHFVALFTDITERKRAEEALLESERFVARILDSSPNLIYIYDLVEHRNVYANREVSEFLGYTPAQIEEFGPHLFERILHPEDADAVARHHARLEKASDDDVYDVEYRMKHSSGQWRWLRSRDVAFARDENRCVTQILGFTEDISERKRAEDEVLLLNVRLEERVRERTEALEATNDALAATNAHLRELNVELEEATRAKSDFLAGMSHELRTPLNSIIGFSGTLLQGLAGPLNAEQETQVRMVSASGRHLLTLIDEILDLSRIESGHAAATLEEFEVPALVSDALEMVRPMADGKDIGLPLVFGPGTDLLTSDPRHIRQILINLLANAVKFTDAGTVSVAVYVESGQMVFAVADTGCGIRDDDIPHLMDDFFQAAPMAGAKSAGTGLGLPIVSRLADAIGGTVDVVSEFGVGSTFTLRVPCAAGE
jgi:PAS domain S-box-containing protein